MIELITDTTRSPSAAKRNAMAAAIPLGPSVIMATFPFSLAICPDLCVSFEDKGGSFQAACRAALPASAINSSTDHWS